jgi:hypothetical protein
MVMARIFARCGEYEKSIEEIDYILSLESDFTVNDFKMDRDFAPLRDLSEFQMLMNKYALPADS